MALRRIAALIVPLISLSCGGHSTPTEPTAAHLDLATGAYALTVSMSGTGEPTCSNGICLSGGICSTAGGDPGLLRRVTTAVQLDRAGDAITIRPDDAAASFRMELHVDTNVVNGTASGQFKDGNVQVSITSAQGGSAAVITGTVQAASVTGKIDGQVGVGGYSCSNNGHTWALVPR